MKQILIKNSIFFNQVAIVENGKLLDYFYEENDKESLLGNIYKGKVMDILQGMEAIFVDIGLDKNAYLYKNDLLSDKFLIEREIRKKDTKELDKIIKKGEEILVQINREPMGEKNISVTTDISLTGKYIALLPQSKKVNISSKIRKLEERKRLGQIGKDIMTENNGMIIRTYSENCSSDDIEKEYKVLSSMYKKIEQEYQYSYAPKLLFQSNSLIERVFYDYIDSTVDEIYVEDKSNKIKLHEIMKNYDTDEFKNITIKESSNVFDLFSIEKQIDILFNRKIELDNGGSIFIDVTEALTVIDVNSGKYIGNKNLEETALSLNLVALDEIARQIKLRNISGIILIDFIDLRKKEHVDLILNKAKTIFNKEKTKVNVVGMTKLNLMEITRKKNKENFFNLMTKECEHCSGGGRISSNIHVFLKLENIVRKIRNNTSCEAVILKVGSILYNEMTKEFYEIINKIENKYKINIYFEEDKSILTEDIVVGKMGKIEYIKSQK